jgi:ketosteroid isomerase-like protein
MTEDEMMALVLRHFRAEGAGDVDGAIAVYTDDVEHDAVGFADSPRHGKAAARAFYQTLVANFRGTGEQITRRYVADDALTIDSVVSGLVAAPDGTGDEVEISFRMLHVFESRDGLISRENVWTDDAAISAQLSRARDTAAPHPIETPSHPTGEE